MPRKSPNAIDVHVGKRVRMRRMMLAMSQEKLGDALGITFQQVQKNEKGTNRIGASRLRQIAQILDVPESFFFEGAPNSTGFHTGGTEPNAPAPAVVSDFLATTDGLTIATNFCKIKDAKMRRHLATLIELTAAA